MATKIRNETGIEPELVEGGRGEFTVWVDGAKVAEKGWLRFPSDLKVIDAVRNAVAAE